jgi:hypothetical protein
MSRWVELAERSETRHRFNPAQHVVNRAHVGSAWSPGAWHGGLDPTWPGFTFYIFSYKYIYYT